LRTNTKSFTLTEAEYKKGLSQGVNTWVITTLSQTAKRERVYCLTEEAFNKLITLANVIINGEL
jgi:hypothetical protein